MVEVECYIHLYVPVSMLQRRQEAMLLDCKNCWEALGSSDTPMHGTDTYPSRGRRKEYALFSKR